VIRQVHMNMSEKLAQLKRVYREEIDLLRSRIKLLSGRDKLLLTMYLDKGTSFRQMAQLIGVSDTIIARRIYRLIRRLTDGRYVACLRNRSRLSEAELAIAKDHFLMGLPIKKIAQKYEFTEYGVDKTLEHIREIITDI